MISEREYIKKLTKSFDVIKTSNSAKTAVRDTLKKEFNFINASSYIIGVEPIDEATPQELYWLGQGLKMAPLDKDIKQICLRNFNVDEYFTDIEKQKFTGTKKQTKTESKLPIVFGDVAQVTVDQWLCTMDARSIYGLSTNGLLRYNVDTQRPVKYTSESGTFTIDTNKKSIDQMADLMEKGQFISNAITFNINLDDDNTDFVYNDVDRVLTLQKGNIDIIDGFHRLLAMAKVIKRNDEWNQNFIVNIMNFDTEKACHFISQEDKRNPINKNYVKSLDSTNPTYLVIEKLNTDALSVLKGKITKKPTQGTINQSSFFAIVDNCVAINSLNISERKSAVSLAKKIENVFNDLVDEEIVSLDEGISLEDQALIVDRAMQDKQGEIKKHIKKLHTYIKKNGNLFRNNPSKSNIRKIHENIFL